MKILLTAMLLAMAVPAMAETVVDTIYKDDPQHFAGTSTFDTGVVVHFVATDTETGISHPIEVIQALTGIKCGQVEKLLICIMP
jgi:hypothetical protein